LSTFNLGIFSSILVEEKMESNEIVAYVAIALSVSTAVLGVINHKRVRSTCCGKKVEVSLDVEATTPPDKADKIDLRLPGATDTNGK
jgi:hypothetical protein